MIFAYTTQRLDTINLVLAEVLVLKTTFEQVKLNVTF